jgi:hypothetical protein
MEENWGAWRATKQCFAEEIKKSPDGIDEQTFLYYSSKLDAVIEKSEKRFTNMLNVELISMLDLDKKEGKSGNTRKKIKERLKRYMTEPDFIDKNFVGKYAPPQRVIEQLKYIITDTEGFIITDDTELPSYTEGSDIE